MVTHTKEATDLQKQYQLISTMQAELLFILRRTIPILEEIILNLSMLNRSGYNFVHLTVRLTLFV